MSYVTTFHDPLFVGAVTKFKTLIDKGYVDAALLSNDYGASQAAFGGLFAMTASGVIAGSLINIWLVRRRVSPRKDRPS